MATRSEKNKEDRWWLVDGEPHAEVYNTVQRIRRDQSYRDTEIMHAWRLYGGQSVPSFSQYNSTPVAGFQYDRLPTNVVRRVCGTLVSELAQNRPRPMFLTTGGDYALQKQAEKLTQFTEGLFDECRVDLDISARCGQDAIVFGSGVAHVFEQDGRVQIERVFPSELIVEDQDAIYGAPRCVYYVKLVDRFVLGEHFPAAKAQVHDARPPSGDWVLPRSVWGDQVIVIEAWRLPDSKDSSGRHVICVDTATLVDEEYTEPVFPFVFLHWEIPVLGFWSSGVAEALTGAQMAINRLERNIQEAQSLMGNFRIWVDRNSRVNKAQLTNETGAIGEYSGSPPTFATYQAVHPEIYQERQYRIQAAYEEVGVSQLAAHAEKPAGLDSGRALRVFIDNQSKRFLRFLKAYEQFHVDLADRAIRVLRKLSEDDPSYEVVYKSKSSIDRIRWKDVQLDTSAYRLDVFPASALPNTPAGRLQAIQDLFQAQLIDQDTFLKLCDFPDLKAEMGQLTAPIESVEADIASILDEGVYKGPEPLSPLGLCVAVGGRRYLEARNNGVSEEKLEMLRQYIEEAQALQAQAQKPATPPQGSAPSPPGAAPPMGPPGPPAPPSINAPGAPGPAE